MASKRLLMVFVVVLASMAVSAIADDDNMQRASGSARITFTFGAVVVDSVPIVLVKLMVAPLTGDPALVSVAVIVVVD